MEVLQGDFTEAIARIREARIDLAIDNRAVELMEGKTTLEIRILIHDLYKQHKRTGEVQAMQLADTMLEFLNARLRKRGELVG